MTKCRSNVALLLHLQAAALLVCLGECAEGGGGDNSYARAGAEDASESDGGGISLPRRSISWWWDDNHHKSADGLIKFCSEHRDIVTRVMMVCEVFTCIAADWANASAPKDTCTNNAGVGGTVTGQLSDKCKQAIPALAELGIKTELWLGEDDSITSARYQFAHAQEIAASLLRIAKENPGLSGVNLDLESGAPFSDSDRLAYHEYLHNVTVALQNAPAGPLRFSADLECRNPATDRMMSNCSAVVGSGLDRLYTMYTYNSADYYEWVTVQLKPALETVPLNILGVGLGCYSDAALNGTWNLTPEAAEDRVCKLMNASVQEIGMFDLSQGTKDNPGQLFPPPYWVAPLQRFIRGEACNAKIAVAPHCPNATVWPPLPPGPAWKQGGYDNDWDCCTSGSSRGAGRSCDAACAHAECLAAGMHWLPLNNSLFPFTCCNNHTKV